MATGDDRIRDDLAIRNEQRINAIIQRIDERFTEHQHVHDLEKEQRGDAYIELQRRLDELNHAHTRAVEVQRSYVSRELYEAAHASLVTKIDVLANTVNDRLETILGRLASVEGSKAGAAQAWAWTAAAFGAAIAVASIIIAIVVGR